MNIDEIVQKINPEEDYKIKDITDMLSVSPTAIQSAINRGKLPARRLFGKFYIKGRVLRSFMLGEKIIDSIVPVGVEQKITKKVKKSLDN
jgi:nucleoid DNA-binding protein